MSGRPFAEAVEDERGVFRLWLDGELQGGVLLDYAQAHAVTAALNTRVEAREAKLRGLLSEVGAALIDIRLALKPLSGGEPRALEADMVAAGAIATIRDETVNAHEYVHGDVACGLAFDLGVTHAALRDLRVVVDALDGGVAELAPFLEAMGLRRSEPVSVHLAGARGGKVTATAIAAVVTLSEQRRRTRPPSGRHDALHRWEGEQAAFSMVLSVLRGENVTAHRWSTHEWTEPNGDWHTNQPLRGATAHLDLCLFDAPQCQQTRWGPSRYCEAHRAMLPRR